MGDTRFNPLAGKSELRHHSKSPASVLKLSNVSIPLRGKVNCGITQVMLWTLTLLGFNPLAGKSELRPQVVKALPSEGSRSGFRPPLMLNSLRAENHLSKIPKTLTGQGNGRLYERICVSAI